MYTSTFLRAQLDLFERIFTWTSELFFVIILVFNGLLLTKQRHVPPSEGEVLCHVAIKAQAKTLEQAQQTQLKQNLASRSPTHTREHPTVTKWFRMGRGKLGRGTEQQHKKAAPHSSPCRNEQQTTGGMEFLHICDTRGTNQYSAGILLSLIHI